jgi:SAM-dependent methyltransferase
MPGQSPDLYADLAEVYERSRPGYAPEAVDWIGERLALGSGSRIADVGAGTGKLTRQLLGLRAEVIAVEPVEGMRNQFSAVLPAVSVLAATAESLPFDDASLDAVAVGMAFHWFDAARALTEFARVLRRGGGVAIFLNYPDPEQPLDRALNEISAPVQRRTMRFDSLDSSGRFPTGAGAFASSPRFGHAEEQSFGFVDVLDRTTLVERYASFASIAALPDAKRLGTLEQLGEIVARAPEPINYRMITHVSVARLLP